MTENFRVYLLSECKKLMLTQYRKSRETVYRGFNGGTNYSLESMQAQNTNTNR